MKWIGLRPPTIAGNTVRAFRFTFLLLYVFTGQHSWGDEVGLALRNRAVEAMRQALARMPNYLCTATLTRSIAEGGGLHRRGFLDRSRFDVAFLGGKEMYSWPGEASFVFDDPQEMLGRGLSGIGGFASFSRTVFDSDATEATTAVSEVRAGRKVIRFGYRVPLEKSGYQLRSALPSISVEESGYRFRSWIRSISVGYHGAFWADPVTGRVLALEIEADSSGIPQGFGISSAKTVIEYQNEIDVNDARVALPISATLTVSRPPNSTVNVNRVEYAACREYSTHSAIRFEENTSAASEEPSLRQLELPANLVLEVALEDPVLVASSAAGDVVRASLVHPLEAGGSEVPSGAVLVGRVLRLERSPGSDTTHVQLGFSHLRFGSVAARFRARIAAESMRGPLVGGPAPVEWKMQSPLGIAEPMSWMSGADFMLRGEKARLRKGFHMKWITL